jgi:hypothetical protein
VRISARFLAFVEFLLHDVDGVALFLPLVRTAREATVGPSGSDLDGLRVRGGVAQLTA